jgi:hypothetical protein
MEEEPMATASEVLRIVHVLTAALMVWPFYALVAVNQRARLGPPVGDRVDTYMENIIKNRTVPCFVFQMTAMLTGLVLTETDGPGLANLFEMPILGAKVFLLLAASGLLGYVHLTLQPKIDSLFQDAAGDLLPSDILPRINALRIRRKRLASVCLFLVITMIMLGVETWADSPVWFLVVAVGLLLVFSWRAYKSVTPWGWW